MKHTFDQIPNILKRIEEKLDNLESILLERIQNEVPVVELICSKDACKMLKLSLPTLYSKVCLHEIPFYKKGNRLHFSKTELLEWIREGREKSLNELSDDDKDIFEKNN